jgi:hypothetical protein
MSGGLGGGGFSAAIVLHGCATSLLDTSLGAHGAIGSHQDEATGMVCASTPPDVLCRRGFKGMTSWLCRRFQVDDLALMGHDCFGRAQSLEPPTGPADEQNVRAGER